MFRLIACLRLFLGLVVPKSRLMPLSFLALAPLIAGLIACASSGEVNVHKWWRLMELCALRLSRPAWLSALSL